MPENQKRPGLPLQIETIYALIARDEAGAEGIAAVKSPMGALQCVATNPATLGEIAAKGELVGLASGETIELVEFTRSGVVRRLTR